MDVDRRQCDNYMCEFIESKNGSMATHKKHCDHWKIEKRIEANIQRNKNDKNQKERAMYFIKTNHAVLPENKYKQRNDKSYAVYKVGKTNNSLRRVIRSKKIHNIRS